jgi:hypothetical protein
MCNNDIESSYDLGFLCWNNSNYLDSHCCDGESSSSSFPVLGLLRPVTGVTKLNPSIFPKVWINKFLFPFGWYFRTIFGILSELILSTCSFQFFLYWYMNSVICDIFYSVKNGEFQQYY